MTRCSQKTAKGLRCKSHGVEHDGKIICATHLKHMMPELIPLIPSAATAATAAPPPPCTHKSTCDLTHDKCCECSDERPIQEEGYVAYINTHLADAVLVPRHYYYCPSCRERFMKNKEAVYMSLWNSGCEELCYHFGLCSDVMGDCWEPVYDKSGLEGLKKDLRLLSKVEHNAEGCEDCKKWIESLHD